MYHKAEREYRQATTPRERLARLEKMLALIPKHKGTDKLQADIKRKLKEARSDVAAGGSGTHASYGPKINRQGCGQILVIGGPNAGKSQVVASVTNATPEVAPYPYTTRTMTPGMMEVAEVTVQVIDTPPIAEGSVDPQLLNLIRATDAVALCLNGGDDESPEATAAVVRELRERKTVLGSESAYLEDGLSMLGVRCRLVLTNCAADDAELRLELFQELVDRPFPIVRFDRDDSDAIAATKQALFDSLELIRVFTKRPGQPVDRSEPFTLPKGSTVEAVAEKVHEEVARGLRFARLWSGTSTEAQTVGREYVVQDGDVVEFHG